MGLFPQMDIVNHSAVSRTTKYIYDLFENITVSYTQKQKPIPTVALEALLQMFHFYTTTKSSYQTESFYTHLLYSILATVCAQMDCADIVTEEDIFGEEIKAHGRFEFMIKCGKVRICIVETKRESMVQGVVQGLTGSEVIAELGNLTVSLCIVVIGYKRWLFYKNQDEGIARFVYELQMVSSSLMPTEDSSLKTLTSCLYAFFSFEFG